ncbi:GNAT family N-acetyltransferase [Subtercola lobariae]|uniref:N-acetyltransferase domain-containing protein n=1 Tax=Subtercola lobariae TaxID=1588641 RepID=A0A917B5A4_9MICO|nr:GNAT family N-acetyltransferase [Subtercola lobariae]GGF24762.1 hypothetical protein GCM10011399_17820 [Subtercola lobariae]
MQLRETPVTSEPAVRLLTEYFTSRELDFPTNQGVYRVTFPPPEQFVPPVGVFLVVETGEGDAGGEGDAAADTVGHAVGCGGIRRIADGPTGARYEVKHVFIEPAARGQGLAAALMAELEARAAAFGAAEVVLDTNASLEAAARLYARLGYHSIAAYNTNTNATNWYAKTLG